MSGFERAMLEHIQFPYWFRGICVELHNIISDFRLILFPLFYTIEYRPNHLIMDPFPRYHSGNSWPYVINKRGTHNISSPPAPTELVVPYIVLDLGWDSENHRRRKGTKCGYSAWNEIAQWFAAVSNTICKQSFNLPRLYWDFLYCTVTCCSALQ